MDERDSLAIKWLQFRTSLVPRSLGYRSDTQAHYTGQVYEVWPALIRKADGDGLLLLETNGEARPRYLWIGPWGQKERALQR